MRRQGLEGLSLVAAAAAAEPEKAAQDEGQMAEIARHKQEKAKFAAGLSKKHAKRLICSYVAT